MPAKGAITRDYQDKLTGASYMFAGLNNVIDPYNIPIDKGFVPHALNVDIDNTNSVSRRDGYTQSLASVTAHSGWSDGVSAFFVDDIYLKTFDGTTTSIVDVVTKNARMWFCKANDVVVYSNGIESGVIGGNFTQTDTYSSYFKENTEFGICLEFQNGRVYHAKGNSVFCTDVFDVEHTDVRHAHVLTVRSPITMIRRVEGGLYVGSESQTHFLKGSDIVAGGYELVVLADYGVVLGTDVSTTGEYIPDSKSQGQIAMWTSKRGICTGGAGGNFLNHSVHILSIPECNEGCAIIKDVNGFRQYVVVLNNNVIEYNPYPTPTFDVNTL